ncbi:MAG: HAMP domain-containing histidine kinase [Myxococcales bacterium]|nr:HAMP domain-containing histidine kinase [Myxococcales bacterium]MCB9519805.1 HAMP domain-containing histidine kinase [Myxococcales bacterium]
MSTSTRTPSTRDLVVGGAPRLAGTSGGRATLVRLRWGALVGQVVTIATVSAVWHAELPLAAMAGVLAVLAVSNLILARSAPQASENTLGAVLVFDVALLTAMLALAGGPSNPFTVLYLVHVILAAMLTGPRWTWIVVATSCAGFALQFVAHVPLPAALGGHGAGMASTGHGAHAAHDGHMSHAAAEGAPYSAHLQGMWAAYAITATAIGAFASRLSAALDLERRRQANTERLLGLAAIAAGAAHEIGNPLGTIRIASEELARTLRARAAGDELVADAQLISDEVRRASVVLDQLAAAAGEVKGAPISAAPLGQIVASAASRLGDALRVDAEVEAPDAVVRWPVEAVSQAVAQLVRNGLQASPPGGRVTLRAEVRGDRVELAVIDRGEGMSAETLARIGEPFFSTKQGDGMGLGVFAAAALVRRMGGALSVDSSVGEGTTVRIELPVDVGAA